MTERGSQGEWVGMVFRNGGGDDDGNGVMAGEGVGKQRLRRKGKEKGGGEADGLRKGARRRRETRIWGEAQRTGTHHLSFGGCTCFEQRNAVLQECMGYSYTAEHRRIGDLNRLQLSGDVLPYFGAELAAIIRLCTVLLRGLHMWEHWRAATVRQCITEFRGWISPIHAALR